MGINEDGEERLDSDCHSHHNGEDFSDPNLDKIPKDIDDEGGRRLKMYTPFDRELESWLSYTKWPWGPHAECRPRAPLAFEFPYYLDIIPTHRLVADFELEDLFVGQQFVNKEDCLFSIKRYRVKVLVDFKVAKSTPTLYIGECWRSREWCNWWVRATFIRRIQLWMIRKFEGPHTCTATHMTQDHRKLDVKTICNCIMPLVKDMPTILCPIFFPSSFFTFFLLFLLFFC